MRDRINPGRDRKDLLSEDAGKSDPIRKGLQIMGKQYQAPQDFELLQ